ncbi:MAG: MarR family transcriptional regulator [Frankiales bacterium]|nr:MarR family transcriptional regulator [Frankiales bacterium]MCW2586319.1 MarR family transcriptional regulator [Frankiales bacterium]
MPAPELEQQLNVLARRLSRPVRLHGPSGFTVLDRPAYQALWRIVDEGPVRPTALAGLLGVDLSVVSRQVRSLEDVGFVQRQPDPADARAALISATESGLRAFETTRQQRNEVLGEVLADWPAQDRTELVRLLTRFNSELESAIARRQAGGEA